MRIPFFDMRAELAAVRDDVDRAIARVLDSGVLIGGPEVETFERALAAACGVRRAVGVSSGTDALLAIGMALGWGPRMAVVTTPLTFFATVGAIVRTGATPVFADVEEDRLTLDPAAAAAELSDHTSAVLPVHLFGLPARPMPAGVTVVEDAAQSIGAAPVRGVAAALSFFPTKNLGAIGDAGAVLTDDHALADRIAIVRAHGAKPKYHHVILGGNFRLDAIQAAVLAAKLPHLARWTAARRAHAAAYRAAFAAAGLADDVRLPPDEPEHVYHQFVIRTPVRDRLRAALAADGIGTEVYYPHPLHLAPALSWLDYTEGACPRAEAACAEVLALPIHPALPADAPAIVVEAIARFFKGDGPAAARR